MINKISTLMLTASFSMMTILTYADGEGICQEVPGCYEVHFSNTTGYKGDYNFSHNACPGYPESSDGEQPMGGKFSYDLCVTPGTHVHIGINKAAGAVATEDHTPAKDIQMHCWNGGDSTFESLDCSQDKWE